MALALATPTAADAATDDFVILTDNQATITACAQPVQQSGQYIIRSILLRLGQIINRSLHVQWLPSHDIGGID
jgi:hypothetical protein